MKVWFFKTVILLSVIVTSLVFYNSCGTTKFTSIQNGTSVGNPMTSTKLLESICTTLTRCNSQLSMSQCEAGVLATGGIDVPIGVQGGIYPTYSNIVTAEQSGVIAGNILATDTCDVAIDSLSCGDPTVLGAYVPGASNPFAGVPQMIPLQPADSCQNSFSPITNWKLVDGTGTSSFYTSLMNGKTPRIGVLNSKLYATWYDSDPSKSMATQIRVSVYNGNDTAPAWASVDGGGQFGINQDTTKNTYRPKFETFNSKLYITFREQNAAGVDQVRVKVYNGNDAAPVWTSVDGNGANGINFDVTKTAGLPRLITLNSSLYAVWTERAAPALDGVIRVAVYNGNDAAPAWSFVDGGGANGLNQFPTNLAGTPSALVFNSKLYVAFYEDNGTSKQMRVKVFNGNNAAPAWSFADGGGTNGLNYDNTKGVFFPEFGIVNSKLYLVWEENPSNQVFRLHVRVYNGNDSAPSWTFVDGGANGINRDPTKLAEEPKIVALGSNLYVAWDETVTGGVVVHVASYNGKDSSPVWTAADNGAVAGPFNGADASGFGVFANKVYLIWSQFNGVNSSMHAAVGN